MIKTATYFLLLLFSAALLPAQNTVGGKAVQVPEAEVQRQSAFVDAERERLLAHYDKAIELYKKFLRENAGNDAAWYGLARCYTSKHELVQALESIGKAAAIAPENPWYQVYRADLYEKMDRPKDAVAVYEALTAKHPDMPEFFERLAYLAVLSGNPQGGLKALDRLEKLTGLTEEVATRRHMIYVGLGEDKKAAAELQRLADAHPQALHYRHRLAEFYTAMKNTDAARRVYEDILRRDPDDAAARLAVLGAARSAGSSSDAAYLQSLRPLFANPQGSIDAKIKELLPYFDKLQKGADAATVQALLDLGAALETAHASDPKAWSVSGDLLYYANRPAEALEKYRRCIQLNPTVFSVWDNTLSILAEQGNFDEMLRLGEQAMDAFPNQPRAYLYYGQAAIEKGRPDDAVSQLEQALLMAGNNIALRLDIQDQIGRALLAKKDVAGARAHYEAALSKGGDRHAGVLEHYGDALYQAGERNKAVEYWQKANALAKSPALEQKIATGKL
jgi:tetratricopeptide (TPR) repeat protein